MLNNGFSNEVKLYSAANGIYHKMNLKNTAMADIASADDYISGKLHKKKIKTQKRSV